MRYLIFNWDDILIELSDPDNLSDAEYEELAKNYGKIYDNNEDFQTDFNSGHLNTATDYLRIIK